MKVILIQTQAGCCFGLFWKSADLQHEPVAAKKVYIWKLEGRIKLLGKPKISSPQLSNSSSGGGGGLEAFDSTIIHGKKISWVTLSNAGRPSHYCGETPELCSTGLQKCCWFLKPGDEQVETLDINNVISFSQTCYRNISVIVTQTAPIWYWSDIGPISAKNINMWWYETSSQTTDINKLHWHIRGCRERLTLTTSAVTTCDSQQPRHTLVNTWKLIDSCLLPAAPCDRDESAPSFTTVRLQNIDFTYKYTYRKTQ